MKTYKPTSVSKLVDRFDNELKRLLMEDLSAIRASQAKFINNIQQGIKTDSLSAA
ncbi:hypothetical protein [Mucilaginibacter paludis]|uniref:Uncharacterized protein n=1 Tax=Mucilaginibacter paludis DSM 18603 TaxID=714943 RepID=H1YAW4_9SPHI|nr:hypothetical protein [Mucilaginibacter paludis]EHQ29573.1 hypothetical protein Mucpa_5501 [Mucilaginibacter paludis DSM 18603]